MLLKSLLILNKVDTKVAVIKMCALNKKGEKEGKDLF